MQQYREYLVKQMPRLMNLLDKDPSSPTYGCFDRAYWHYKYAKDFPDAMFQNNINTLAIFYKTNFPGNVYYGKISVLEFIKASIKYTLKIQNNNGSWSEAYPNEYSYVTTSFVLYNLAKALLLIKDKFEPQDLEKIERSLNKARVWLISFKGPIPASNQLAAGAAAIINANKVCGINDHPGYSDTLDSLYGMQHPKEGWFKEYGGFDLGYSSLSLHFLADIYNNLVQPSQKLEGSIQALLRGLQRYMDFDYLGNIGSRNTAYFLPGGLRISDANLLNRMLVKLAEMQIPGPHCFDDKYFAEYLFSYAECVSGVKFKTLPSFNSGQAGSPSVGSDSAIHIVEIDGKDKIMINLAKNGSWTNSDGSMHFNGYLLAYKNAYFTLRSADQYTVNQDAFQIRSCLTRLKHLYPLAGLGIFFVRLYNYTLCRFSFINRLIDDSLKNNLLIKGASGGLPVTRNILLKGPCLIVNDQFSMKFPAGTLVRTGHDFSSKNISSSKFGAPLNSQFESIAKESFRELKISFNLENREIRVNFSTGADD